MARSVPIRTCVTCRTARPKWELQRIVRTPDGSILADETGRLAGRGAYVCRATDCLTSAIQKGALTRALRTSLPAAFREAVATGAGTITHDIEGGARGQE